VITRSADGSTRTDPLPLTPGREALLELEWREDRVLYSVDGTVAVEHASVVPGPLFPIASEYSKGGDLLAVVSFQVGGPEEPGAGWVLSGPLPRADQLEWAAPAGTTVQVEVESGDQPGSWEALAQPGPVAISAPLMRLRATIQGPGPITFSGRCNP